MFVFFFIKYMICILNFYPYIRKKRHRSANVKEVSFNDKDKLYLNSPKLNLIRKKMPISSKLPLKKEKDRHSA